MGLQGQKIEAPSFNIIKNASILVYGSGSGMFGYGQSVIPPSSTGDLISASVWSDLRSELVKARQHQTGIPVGTGSINDGNNLVDITPGMLITDEIRQQYYDFAGLIELHSQDVAISELVPQPLVSGQRNISWNGTVVQAITIQGSAAGDGRANNLRYFFNAGGKINLTPYISGGIETSKLLFWRDVFLPQVGSVQFSATNTTNSGISGISSNLGFYNLTGTDQVLYTLNASGIYEGNSYKVTGSISSDQTTIILKAVFSDNADYGSVDQNVTGSLHSDAVALQPLSSNVTVLSLEATEDGLNDGVPPLSFEILPRLSTINETTNRQVIFDVASSDIGMASTMYWSTIGNVSNVDFSDASLTGSVNIDVNGVGSITRELATDKKYDGVESFQLLLHSNSPTGLEVCRSSVVTIADTSNYEIVSASSVNEGANFTFTVNSTSAANSTRLYVTLTGTAAASIGANQGFIDIVGGTATKTFLIPSDNVTDPGQTFSIQLRTTSASGPIAVTSSPITVIDKTPTYTVTYSTADWILSEGENLSYTVHTTNVPNGTYLYVSIINHPSSGVLSGDIVSGLGTRLVLINNNVGTGYISMAVNGGTEPERYFYLNFTTVFGALVHSSSWVNPLGWFVLRAHGLALYYASGGSYSFGVPRGVTSILVTAIGPGGGGAGYHDSGYGTYARPGGPGGGVQVRIPVSAGQVITIALGKAGTQGYYGGSDWAIGYGKPATHTAIYDAGGLAAYAYSGGNYNKTPGSGYIRPGLSGSVFSGTHSVEIGAREVGYSIWNFIGQGYIGINGAGVPPGFGLPSGVNNQAGRAERPGWVTIQY